MDRRRVLGTVGGIVVGSIAGCSGDGNSTERGTGTPSAPASIEYDEDANAELQIVGVVYPDEVRYGSEFSTEIQYGNVGGEAFEETVELSLARLTTEDTEPQTAEFDIGALDPGSTGSATVDFEATAAGDYRLEPGEKVAEVGDDVEPLLTVLPASRSSGEEIEDRDNLRYTLQGVQFEQSILDVVNQEGYGYDEKELINLRSTLEDRIIAVFEMDVSNAGTNGQSISTEKFAVPDGTPLTGYNDPVLGDNTLFGRQINPGESISGYLPYVVPKSGIPELSFGVHIAPGSGPADIEVPFGRDPASFPTFELSSQAVPSQFNDGETRFGFTIENAGEAIGTFRGYLQFMFLDDPGLFSSYEANEW